LQKLTPAWIPAAALWGYATGAALLAAAGALLVNRYARTAATWLGLLLLFLTAVIYAPILATAVQSSEMVEGLNYVADTLLFAGATLLLAEALHDRPDRARPLPGVLSA
jgi:hypothetical protein